MARLRGTSGCRVCFLLRRLPTKKFNGWPCNHLARPYVWVTARFLAFSPDRISAVRSSNRDRQRRMF
jgi:hypothetical protein